MAILKIKDGDEWEEIASIKGDTGDKGEPGPANTLSIGTVQSGDTASAEITGNAPNQTLNLVLPKGDKGDTGSTGKDGVDGQDGVSPTVETSKSGKTTTITITDAEGEHTATILDGNDGASEWGNIYGSLSDQTDLKNALDAKADSSDIPTKVSDLTNDSGYLTSSSLPTKVSDLTNDTGFITNTVNNLTNYYTKSNTYTKSEVDSLIGAVSSLNIEVVQTLPTQDISTSTIYLVPKTTSETNDSYDEYIYVSNNWEHIGSTDVDLSGYQTKIDSSHKLSADLVDDISTTNKFVTASDKTTWNAKYSKPSGGIPSTDLSSAVQASLGKADTALQSETYTGTITSVKMNGTTVSTSGEADLGTVITSHQDISNKQDKIDSSHKLSSDLVDDTNQTNKFVSASDKTTWNGKYDKPSGGIPSTDMTSAVQTSLGKADSALQSITSGDVTTALGYTPYDSSNPSGYTSNTGTITDVQVNSTSAVSSGVANLVTETAYNSSTNKIATMSDVPLDFYGQGTSISSDTDLDTLLTLGKYYANADSTAQTLSNCPTNTNFVMYVINRTTYVSQIIIDRRGRIYSRSMSSGGFSEWITPSNYYFGTCSTATTTRNKAVTCPEFALVEGVTISVLFDYSQGYNGAPQLNVNSTGNVIVQAKDGTDAVRYIWAAGEVVDFTYNGTAWIMHKGGIATTTYYGITKLSSSLTTASASVAANSYAIHQLVSNIVSGVPIYSSSDTYAVGDRVRYSYNIWKCTTAITTAEDWDETHWTTVDTLQSQVDDLQSELNDLQSELNEKIWTGTENQYDAITTKNPNTLYCIVES